MVQNLYSLGLLRNGKVYANKQLAIQGLTQAATNDGVAKLARYLYTPENSNEAVIRTVVGFYANAAEMEDNGGGASYYTILDVEGSAADIAHLQQEINAINSKIGDGFDGKTLTQAINEANAAIEAEEARAISAETELQEAIDALETALTTALTVTLEVKGTPTEGYLKTYELKQGGNSVGTIDIPKDMVVSGGSLVHGTWDGDTFTEDPDGPDTAIKIEFANSDTIYINTKDLVDFYTAGNAAIGIDNDHNTISLVLDRDGEPFLTVSESGLKLAGVQTAIDTKAEEVAARERLEGSDGISIVSNKVKAVAAGYSAPAIKNPISVDKDGIKFSSMLDCGFYDDETEIANTAEDINAITDPQNTDVFLASDEAFNAASNKAFKSIEASDINAASQVSLAANESIVLDDIDVTGNKGTSNAFVGLNAPSVEISNATVADGAKPYNVFEQVGNSNIDSFSASNVKVDDVALKHNVFNVYRLENDAVINISDTTLNLDVNNSNALRLANYTNATGVTVNFENVAWTYENTPNKDAADWGWAGLIIYQPASADVALGGDLSKIQTWNFNFKNCKYNGVKVTANNFGEKNQVFYLYNIGGDGSIKDPVANGLTLNFE